MRVILFDIDGTLVRTGGAGKHAMESALREEFGLSHLYDKVPYSGRTDRAIGRDLLAIHGIDPSPANQSRLEHAYLTRLPDSLRRLGGNVCPGVNDLLAALRPRAGTLLGLLTGNVRRGAETKLGHFGLWDYFRCGGFGDLHVDRDDVARAAILEVRAHLGPGVEPADVWVIGDTPLDVQCARAIGAKAVAVATGWHPVTELEACRLDFVFEDLAAPAALLAAWE